jgi:Sulfotransferase domain
VRPINAQVLQAGTMYRDVYVIVAPPRSSSTALARVFWGNPAIRYYCHEPFDRMYHQAADYDAVVCALACPIDLDRLDGGSAAGHSLLIKEMTFQVGADFPTLASITTHPIIFVIREPRLCISSRTRRLQERGHTVFPVVESGWDDLERQVAFCDDTGIHYVVVDSAEFRSAPVGVFRQLFPMLGLVFTPGMLRWRPVTDVTLGGLDGQQDHWYLRVLGSSGVQPETATAPDAGWPEPAGDFTEHLTRCNKIYAKLRNNSNTLRPN